MDLKDEKQTPPLFAYQETGAKWLSEKTFALLADEMGLGKSAQAITAADLIGAKRIAVFCPAIARYNWQKEFALFSKTKRHFDLCFTKSHKPSQIGSLICSYDLAHSFDPVDFGFFDVLILDEVHYLKSVTTKRTAAIFGRKGFSRYAKRIWALSGTPAPNHAGELWPMLYTFGSVAQTYDEFIKRYCVTFRTTWGTQIAGTRADTTPELRQRLEKIMLRRKQIEVLKDLPEILYSTIILPANEVDIKAESSFVQYTIPEDRSEELNAILEREREAIRTILAKESDTFSTKATMLQSVATSVSTLRRYTGLQKVNAVADLVEFELENEAYEKVVIFAIHRDVIEGLRKRLAHFGAVTLYGGTEPEKRKSHLERFEKNPQCRVFIANIQAAGTSVTLTAANQVIFIEQDWVPGNNLQAAKRCHRIGQTKPVFVRTVNIEDSLDKRVSAVISKKMKEIENLMDSSCLQFTSYDIKD